MLVAGAFGVSVAKLAKMVGRSRQTVAKTPDSVALQAALRQFERVARLRAVLPEDDFLKWLRMPNEQLGGSSPLEYIEEGRAEAVGDLVADMLTGAMS